MRSFNYWFDESIHHFRVIAAIAIKKNYYFAARRNLAQPGAKCPPVSATRLSHYARAGGSRNLRRSIGAAVVDDNDLVRDVTRNLTNDFSDRGFFVQRGDDC